MSMSSKILGFQDLVLMSFFNLIFQMAKTTIHVLTMNSNVGPHYVKTRNAYLMTRFAIRKRTVPMVIYFLLNVYLAEFLFNIEQI